MDYAPGVAEPGGGAVNPRSQVSNLSDCGANPLKLFDEIRQIEPAGLMPQTA